MVTQSLYRNFVDSKLQNISIPPALNTKAWSSQWMEIQVAVSSLKAIQNKKAEPSQQVPLSYPSEVKLDTLVEPNELQGPFASQS